jgi:hypothetical protein
VKDDLFCEKNLATVLKRLKNKKALGADCMLNDFLNIVIAKLEISY